MLALTVTNAFGSRSVGETITAESEIAAALASNPASVVRVNLPDAPASEPATAPTEAPGSDHTGE